jgi:hypothetical protein
VSLQVAKLAVFHQEVAVPVLPINPIGHICHSLGSTNRPPIASICIPGMMPRVEALYYVRCTPELLTGNIFINI